MHTDPLDGLNVPYLYKHVFNTCYMGTKENLQVHQGVPEKRWRVHPHESYEGFFQWLLAPHESQKNAVPKCLGTTIT